MNKKILSITGNKPMNYLLKTSFSKEYNVLTAQDIASGISLLKATKSIGLFIIDADYHTSESIDFIKFLSNSGVYAKPVIVLLSDKEIIKDFDSEVNAYFFHKPFNPVTLIAEAKKLLRRTMTVC